MMDGSADENLNPTISHPIDMQFSLESTENDLEWTISDLTIQDPSYTIYIDGILNNSGSWVPGTPIIINLDDLPAGFYNVTILANDGLGGNVSDYVRVTVWNERGLLSHESIFIDVGDEMHDWSTISVITGSGTFVDPYIIENLEIDAGVSDLGIYILDSEVYAKIINCTLTISRSVFGLTGINIENCDNI